MLYDQEKNYVYNPRYRSQGEGREQTLHLALLLAPQRSLIWLLMPPADVMCIQEVSKYASGISKFHEASLLPAGL